MKGNRTPRLAGLSQALMGVFLFIFTYPASAETFWEGNASVGSYGLLPIRGNYGASNSFPRNSTVEIQNLDNGRVVDVLIVDRIENNNLLILLSPGAAEALGVRPDGVTRIRAVPKTDSALGRNGSDQPYSPDPDVNPASALDREERTDELLALSYFPQEPGAAPPPLPPAVPEPATPPPAAPEPPALEPAAAPAPSVPEPAATPPSLPPAVPEPATPPPAPPAPEPLPAVPEPVTPPPPRAPEPPAPPPSPEAWDREPVFPDPEPLWPDTPAYPRPRSSQDWPLPPSPEFIPGPVPPEESYAAPWIQPRAPAAVDLGPLPPRTFLLEPERMPEPAPEPELVLEEIYSPPGFPSPAYGEEFPEFGQPAFPPAPELTAAPEVPVEEVPEEPLVEAPVEEVPLEPLVEAPVEEVPLEPLVEAPVEEVPLEPLVEAPVEEVPLEPLVEAPVEEVSPELPRYPEAGTELVLVPADLRPPVSPPPAPEEPRPFFDPPGPFRPSGAEPSGGAPVFSAGPEPGQRYIQIAAFDQEAGARLAIDALPGNWNLPAFVWTPEGAGGGRYRVLVGPLKADEIGAALYNLRGLGYRDAFIRN